MSEVKPSPSTGHGTPTPREGQFVRLLPPNDKPWIDAKLTELAGRMLSDETDLNDGADAEENLYVPAGYTYFGQFVDHDLSFDTTSNFAKPGSAASSLRTPSLDLDCIYGSGPADQPYMYAADGATLLPDDPAAWDLLRIRAADGTLGRAVIGDKRNDENSIVCQIQLVMIKFHNAVVAAFKAKGLSGGDLFERARQEVTWTYQRLVLEDYLKRIVNTPSYDYFTQRRAEIGPEAYFLYKPSLRTAIPIEFAGAAYRFGHSMVRTGYRLNTQTKKRVFDASDSPEESLIGFQPLRADHVIDDWRRFFVDDSIPPGAKLLKNGPEPVENDPAVRLQFAYKIDTSLVEPLAKLPPSIGGGLSLADLNLRRGNLASYLIAPAQKFAAALGEPLLDAKYLVTRGDADGGVVFKSISEVDPVFTTATPLWFYMLAEAQVGVVDYWIDVKKKAPLVEEDFMSGPCSVSQLGPVGGRILLEVFNGLVDSDPFSFRNHPAASQWSAPLIGATFSFWHLLRFAKLI